MPAPTNLGTSIPDSAMKAPGSGVAESGFRQIDSMGGAQTYALGVATVMQIDYEKHIVTLRTENGETFENTPIPMTYPAFGARHFLGALPLPGDVALIGWGALESGRSRSPYILGWLAGGVTAGHDWWVTQPFGQDEFNLTPTEQSQFEGVANRIRHKLRHMLPGNIVGSSAQGSDLVLDESVLLTNRRGNEILLRDHDQAFVVRSVQQFHAGGGFRIYGGVVQRDATFLPTSMFSDGTYWDAPAQVDVEGNALDESSLGDAPVASGLLTPNKVFQRGASGARDSGIKDFGGNVDPYVFLQRGLFIDASGRATSGPSDAVAGGKALYRVSTDGTNAAIDPQADALTEYRIEVSHFSDGTLPVTEQTDGFDADRLPNTVPRLASPLNDSVNAPFIEFVMGSVVGNDPYSLVGRPLYGVPVRPVVFSGASRAPTLATGLGTPITEHAAVLLKVAPPLDASAQPTFWSVLKDGRVRASFAGPGTDYSAEIALGAGLRAGAGRTPSGDSFRVDADGRITLRAIRGDNATNRGVEISSDQGAVRIFGGGSEVVGGIAQRADPTNGGEGSLPGVTLESATSMLLRASRSLVVSANEIDIREASVLRVAANSAVELQSGDAIKQTSKTRDTVSMGKSTETYTGPKDGLPSNGAVREITIATTPATGFAGGTADKYHLVYGDRSEQIMAGNHDTTVAVGNMSFKVGTGTWSVITSSTQIVASPTGLSITSGAVSVGSASTVAIDATAAVSLMAGATGGVRATPGGVQLVAVGAPRFGGIVSSSDLDPVSGLSLGVLGMGSPHHLLTNV